MRSFALLLFTLAPCLLAEGPEFEVASIKSFDLSKAISSNGAIRFTPSGGGPGTPDPTHMTQMSSPKAMLATAFDLKAYQVVGGDTATDMFEFGLVVPEGATKEDVKIMWRNLLISRFGLKYHMEQRDFQVDELVVGPKGHKLTENTDGEPAPLDPNAGPTMLKTDKEGRPVLPRPGMITMLRLNNGAVTATMVAKAQPVSALVTNLSSQMGHPVVDKTGLNGKWDFSMDFTPPGRIQPIVPAGAGAPNGPAPDVAADPGVDVATAVQQQLGLRLVKGKDKLDVLVVDKLERQPTEN
jgi:uncharacterized protein (TIGR03435 family)